MIVFIKVSLLWIKKLFVILYERKKNQIYAIFLAIDGYTWED